MLIATILAVFGSCVFDDDVKATAAVMAALAGGRHRLICVVRVLLY
jgi:hypothetical protein